MVQHFLNTAFSIAIGLGDCVTTIAQRTRSQHPTTRAEDAGLQEPAFRAAFSGNTRSRLRHLQHPAASTEPQSLACTTHMLVIRLEQGSGVMPGGASKAQQNLTQLPTVPAGIVFLKPSEKTDGGAGVRLRK